MRELLSKSIILSMPGIASLIISLVAIPIHLNSQGLSNYGEYIFFHFILSIGLFLNLGFGKITTVCMGKYQKKSKFIILENINLTIKFCFFYLTLYLVVNFIFNLNHHTIYFFLGLLLTFIYFSFEGIFIGEKKFKKISFINFIFFSLSLNAPSLLLYFKTYTLDEIFLYSLMVKSISIILMTYEYRKYLIPKKTKSKFFLKKVKLNCSWVTLTLMNSQISYFLDKYLIKLFLGTDMLSKYSIPQQLSGKLSIFSQGFSAFLLQNLTLKKEKDKNLIISIIFFLYIIPVLSFIIFPIFDVFLKYWLKSNYENIIFSLFKIFMVYAIFSSTSHLIISKFEASLKIKNNFKIELYCLIPFLIILFLATKNNFSIIFVAIIMLLKETILLILRLNFFKKNIKIIINSCFYNLIFIFIILYLSFFNMIIFYLFIFLFYLPFIIYDIYKLYISKNI